MANRRDLPRLILVDDFMLVASGSDDYDLSAWLIPI